MHWLVWVLVWCSAVDLALATNYSICQEWTGSDFYSHFYWWSWNDPTKGKVDYVTQKDSQKSNLSFVDPKTGRFVLAVDTGDPVPLNGNFSDMGRRSNRIHSNHLYGDGFYILKATKVPTGCATWPAFWTSTKEPWPQGGEIDVIEGVNGKGPNLASLHTDNGCTLNTNVSQVQTGHLDRTNCSYQPGCASTFKEPDTFGDDLNKRGGGYFVLMRDTTLNGLGISVYFWGADEDPSKLPEAIGAAPQKAPTFLNSDDIQHWGKPEVFFGSNYGPNSSCDWSKYMSLHEIIFDTTLCGTWDNGAFSDDGCSGVSCQDYLVNNGEKFADARWEIDYLRIYSNGCEYEPDGKKSKGGANAVRPTLWLSIMSMLVFMLALYGQGML